MKTNKLRGDSPLKLIVITLLIIFFVALFAWQIEKYLAASYDSKLQGQISRMNLIIEADSLDGFSTHKYAYLHASNNIAAPLEIRNRKTNFQPKVTLATLFVKNQFTPSGAPKDACFLFLYFPPGEAYEIFDFYQERNPGYVVAAWSTLKQKPIVAASPGLKNWAEANLKAGDFYCNVKKLDPSKLAVDNNGVLIDLPGANFQFSDQYYSKVKL